jgi:hypothetical protein
MTVVLLIVVAVIVVALVAWFFFGQNPAQGEGGRPDPRDSEAERFYDKTDRPAGPDAESMAPSPDPRPAKAEGNGPGR